MAKTRGLENDQAEVKESDEDAAPEADPRIAAIIRELIARLEAHDARLVRVEQVAHNDHTLGPEAIGHITEHVMGHVHEHLRKAMGHSGLPVRGDQG